MILNAKKTFGSGVNFTDPGLIVVAKNLLWLLMLKWPMLKDCTSIDWRRREVKLNEWNGSKLTRWRAELTSMSNIERDVKRDTFLSILFGDTILIMSIFFCRHLLVLFCRPYSVLSIRICRHLLALSNFLTDTMICRSYLSTLFWFI